MSKSTPPATKHKESKEIKGEKRPKSASSKQEIEQFLKEHKQKKPKIIQEEKAKIGTGKTVLILLAALIVGAVGSSLARDFLFPWLLTTKQFANSEFLQKATEQTTVIQNTKEIIQEQQDTSAKEAISKAGANIVGIYSGTTFVDSGIVLTTDGLIIAPTTNIATDGTYTIQTKRGTKLDATILSHNANAGLTLLQVAASDLPVTTLANLESLEPGDMGLGLAHVPNARQSLAANLVNIGTVRTAQLPDELEQGLLQPTAEVIETAISLPKTPFLFNLHGELIGIQYAAIQKETGSIYVSIDNYRSLFGFATTTQQVRYPIAGFQATPITQELATAKELPVSSGLLITSIAPEGPAELAELVSGDIITAIDGKELSEQTTLAEIIKSHTPKDTLALDIVRIDKDGERTDLKVSVVLE